MNRNPIFNSVFDAAKANNAKNPKIGDPIKIEPQPRKTNTDKFPLVEAEQEKRRNRAGMMPERAVFPVISNQLSPGRLRYTNKRADNNYNERYDQLLNLNRGTLFEYLEEDELPELIDAVGGARNFTNHYGFTEPEYLSMIRRYEDPPRVVVNHPVTEEKKYILRSSPDQKIRRSIRSVFDNNVKVIGHPLIDAQPRTMRQIYNVPNSNSGVRRVLHSPAQVVRYSSPQNIVRIDDRYANVQLPHRTLSPQPKTFRSPAPSPRFRRVVPSSAYNSP